MASPKQIWGLHEFVAENPDEVSFKVGETITVVEQDDAYGDGWWQGTNEAGETGLFPFSYTTLDRDLAMNAKALALSAGGSSTGPAPPPPGLPSSSSGGSATGKAPGVMKSTMADLDQALTELQANGPGGATQLEADHTQSLRSVNNTSIDDAVSEDGDDGPEDEYRSRANARAALAANAKANAASELEKERAEQDRMRAQAQRQFEEEEARQRQVLLAKEEERKAALAKGEVPLDAEQPKVAPIAGVDMSDDSDSEGSVAGLDEYSNAPPVHSPLFSQTQDKRVSQGSQAVAKQPQASPGLPSTASAAGSPSANNNLGARPPLSPTINAQVNQLDATPVAAPAQLAPSSPNGNQATSSNDLAAPRSPYSLNDNAKTSPRVTQGLFAAGAGAAGATAAYGLSSGREGSQRGPSIDSVAARQSGDQRSMTNFARPMGSPQPDSTVGTQTAASSAFPGTPRTGTAPSTTAAASPNPSSASHPKQRAATSSDRDPAEWTVEEVVEWARSKGWDEASVVSKFAEHEISGDILLEMDVNILKEIEISAFGKRFQVANAIKELRQSYARSSAPSGGVGNGSSDASRVASGSYGGFAMNEPQSAGMTSELTASSRGSIASGSNGLASPFRPADYTSDMYGERSNDAMDSSKMVGGGAYSNETSFGGFGMPTSSSAGTGHQKSLSAMADEALAAMNSSTQGSTINSSSASPQTGSARSAVDSPRKRESSGPAANRPPTSAERSSFFSGMRMKRGPSSTVGTPGSVSTPTEEEKKSGLSRFGINRAGNGSKSNSGAPASDLRNQISLPTTSPTYDSQGDTARRNRASQGGKAGATSDGSYNATAGFAGNHGRQASVGSAAEGLASTQSPSAAAADGEGPVMQRIRPVDLEGWIRKKGERYNSWKPRYLALKGSDLVILRDPEATKIKGYIAMKGYKVIADENTNPGKYGFKLLHETEKPHYFSSENPLLIREWMKALIKSTIGRDPNAPVVSSYNNATISLKEAQRMNPPPRPPSPTSRARLQRAKVRDNTTELTAKDAAVLMGVSSLPNQRQQQQQQRGPIIIQPRTSIDSSIRSADSASNAGSMIGKTLGFARTIATETHRPDGRSRLFSLASTSAMVAAVDARSGGPHHYRTTSQVLSVRPTLEDLTASEGYHHGSTWSVSSECSTSAGRQTSALRRLVSPLDGGRPKKQVIPVDIEPQPVKHRLNVFGRLATQKKTTGYLSEGQVEYDADREFLVGTSTTGSSNLVSVDGEQSFEQEASRDNGPRGVRSPSRTLHATVKLSDHPFARSSSELAGKSRHFGATHPLQDSASGSRLGDRSANSSDKAGADLARSFAIRPKLSALDVLVSRNGFSVSRPEGSSRGGKSTPLPRRRPRTAGATLETTTKKEDKIIVQSIWSNDASSAGVIARPRTEPTLENPVKPATPPTTSVQLESKQSLPPSAKYERVLGLKPGPPPDPSSVAPSKPGIIDGRIVPLIPIPPSPSPEEDASSAEGSPIDDTSNEQMATSSRGLTRTILVSSPLPIGDATQVEKAGAVKRSSRTMEAEVPMMNIRRAF